MANRLTRREFLKVGALAATATVVSGCTPSLQRTEYLESYVVPPEEGLPGENLWYASGCRQCGAGCGVLVRTSEGRARKVEGNPLHALNDGRLCARGQAALQEVWDPDRLRNAVQQSGRGSLDFQAVYWPEALTRLAESVNGVDPASVAFLGGNLSSHLWLIVQRFFAALGGRTPALYTLGDELGGQQSLVQGSQRFFGTSAVPLFDVANADAVFSFGASLLETWISPVYYGRAYGHMRRRPLGKRGYMVQFEPRLSNTGASADEWVAIRPGTEGLVALGLGKILVEEGLAKNQEVHGLYEQVDLSQVAEESGVPAHELERLARILGQVAAPLAIPGGAVTGQPNGAEAQAAVQALNALTGQLGEPGGVYLSEPSYGEAFESPPLSTFAEVGNLIDDMAAGRVQVLMVHGANPVYELPPSRGFAQALTTVPFVVSFASTLDETAAQADLILPDHTSMEGWGYHVPALADRRMVTSQQPVMRPIFDTRATVDVLLALARDLGGAVAEALPWPNEVDFLVETVNTLNDGSVSPEVFWAEWRRRGGTWDSAPEMGAPSLSSGFNEPLQVSTEGAGEEADYPFDLYPYPSISLYDGRGANKPWLQETPDPMTTVSWQTWIEINTHTAEELGVEFNDVVRVISPAGEVEAIVYVYPAIPEHVVAIPFGQGHENYGRYAAGRGSNAIKLVAPAVESETGALVWGATRVRIEPTGEKVPLARLESPAGVEYMLEHH